ncbi:hypothetical protein SARC_00429 [Sphaeroforma arctica JP610]|uniref:PHD-type domain-containing protein n=1 Tax=Sphaeroforma arctica JP610 TaxID=667725 RepID=A0A0L0GEJ2_9EUKA|nr:hypothetical protein SARC_00429 [Sphaeroforma arctica JP610]KNC87447.1 hypothetical protein SARC_00429 [Sphaeroforma arctica JP610]|eukprot:XP_014161349.1 hypothetical protein SARC_00429 [Sphaeroforma arctica JP610]
MSESQTYFCPICTRTYRQATPLMLGCEICPIWMHAKCLGVKKSKYFLMDEEEAQDKTIYCPSCTQLDPSKIEERTNKNNEILGFLSAKSELVSAYNALKHNLEPGDAVSSPVRAIVQKRAEEEIVKRSNDNARARQNASSEEAPLGAGPIITLTVSGAKSSDESDGGNRGSAGGSAMVNGDTGKDKNTLTGTQQTSSRNNSRSASRTGNNQQERSYSIKPQNEYQIFKSALMAANPGQSHEEIQLLALHEWALLGPSERRKYTNDASKRRSEHGKSTNSETVNKRSRGNSPRSPRPKKKKK